MSKAPKAPKVNRLAIAVPYSDNLKTGPCAATYASIQGSCDPECPMRKSCYARKGNVCFTVKRLDSACTAETTPEDVAQVEADAVDAMAVVPGIHLRGHVSGECRTARAARIVSDSYRRFRARGGGKVWTYTHAWRTVRRAAWGPGVSVLASVESLDQVREARAMGYGACAIVVAKHPTDGKAWQAEGVGMVIPCPYQTIGIQCVKCKLCMNEPRLRNLGAVVAFERH